MMIKQTSLLFNCPAHVLALSWTLVEDNVSNLQKNNARRQIFFSFLLSLLPTTPSILALPIICVRRWSHSFCWLFLFSLFLFLFLSRSLALSLSFFLSTGINWACQSNAWAERYVSRHGGSVGNVGWKSHEHWAKCRQIHKLCQQGDYKSGLREQVTKKEEEANVLLHDYSSCHRHDYLECRPSSWAQQRVKKN